MDLSPENLKQEATKKKLEDFRTELLPILEKHKASIRGTLIPIEADRADGGKELVFRTGTEVIFVEDEVKEEVKEEEPEPKKKK